MNRAIEMLSTVGLLMLGTRPVCGQSTPPSASTQLTQLTESGSVVLDGKSVPYVIHRLPVSSFPELPGEVAERLKERDCMIPQTYEAHRPENVIRASLQRAGSSDWAVLCATKGTVSLLVFWGDSPSEPMELGSAKEADRLQVRGAGSVLGFDWGIDRASPEQVHEAQSGMEPRPPPLSHDALADSIVEQRTVYHFYEKNAWRMVDMPE